jgi:hypothetical protein
MFGYAPGGTNDLERACTVCGAMPGDMGACQAMEFAERPSSCKAPAAARRVWQ